MRTNGGSAPNVPWRTCLGQCVVCRKALAPQPHAGGQQRRLAAPAEAVIREAVRATPAITLEALCTYVADTQGRRVSVPTMCRALQRLGLPRKKSRSTPAFHADPRDHMMIAAAQMYHVPVVTTEFSDF